MKHLFRAAMSLALLACATLSLSQVENPGFERQALPSNAWQKGVPYNVWVFTKMAGLANGSTPWNHGGAHSGSQYAFIQTLRGLTSSLSQRIYGFMPGQSYHVDFWMARRTETSGVPISVEVDGTAIFGPTYPQNSGIWAKYSTSNFVATSYSHTITFRSSLINTDGASDIDDVSIPGLPAPELTAVKNAGFETPAVATGGFQANPMLNHWQFNADSGIASGATSYGAAAHGGSQYAVLNAGPTGGKISQRLAWLLPQHTYRVRFWMAKGMGASAPTVPLTVSVHGEVISPTISPALDGSWAQYTSGKFVARDEFETVQFSVPVGASDSADLLDDVDYVEDTPDRPTVFDAAFEVPEVGTDWTAGNDYVTNGWVGAGGAVIDVTNQGSSFSYHSHSGKQYLGLTGGSSFTQTLLGLVSGDTYQLRYWQYGTASVSVNGQVLHTSNARIHDWNYIVSNPFVASASTAVLSLVGGNGGGLLEDFSIIDTTLSANDDLYSLATTATLSVPANQGVLTNDVGAIGGTARLIHDAKHGNLNLSPDGSFTYAPYNQADGYDAFSYMVDTNGRSSSPAVVVIRVGNPPSAIIVDNDHFGGLAPAHVTFTLSAPSPGRYYRLNCSDPPVAKFPEWIYVPIGDISAEVPIEGSNVQQPVSATIFLLDQESPLGSVDVTVLPHPLIVSIPASIVGGSAPTGTAGFDTSAPTNSTITLSSDSSAASVPSSVTVPAGSIYSTFTITARVVDADTAVNITATFGTQTVIKAITVKAARVAQVYFSGAVAGGNSIVGLVTLGSITGPSGSDVALSSNNPNATVPASVHVPAGRNSANFTVQTSVVAQQENVTITATLLDSTTTTTLYVTPVVPTDLSGSSHYMVGGNQELLTLQANLPAPTGGITANLSSDNSAATMPSTVIVPSGSRTASFLVTTVAVASPVTVTVTASIPGGSKTFVFYLSTASLASFKAPAAIYAGNQFNAYAIFNGFPSQSTAISSSDPALSAPATVAPMSVSALPVRVASAPVSSSTAVQLTATYAGTARTASVTVLPASNLALSIPTPIVGGARTYGYVYFNGQSTGTDVLLGTQSAEVTVPDSAHFNSGDARVAFLISTAGVSRNTSANVTASWNGTAVTTWFLIVPATLKSVSFSPNTLQGGSPTNLQVFLDGQSTGGTISFSSSDASVVVPGSGTIPAGAYSLSYHFPTTKVASNRDVTVTATYRGLSRSTVIHVTP